MSRALARRPRRRRNPGSELGTGLVNVGVAAAAGAAVDAGLSGAFNRAEIPVWPNATLEGASAGAGLATLGGVIVALVSSRYRNEGLATAGVGLGVLVVMSIVKSYQK
jgi:hypothetical protein